MQLLSFRRVKASRVAEVANLCPDSDAFRGLLNEVVSRIMMRGDFVGTTAPVAFCLRDNCATWPRFVGKVRAAKIGCRAVSVSNEWGYGFLNGTASWWQQWSNCGGSERKLVNIGHAGVYRDIQGENKKVRFYIDCLEDVGKEIILTDFIDSNGQPLKELVDGVWKYQKTLTLANQFVSTAEDIRTFGRVHLPDTIECRVRVFNYDTVTDTLRDMAIYEPGETDPWYARSQIIGGCGGCNNNCDGLTSFVALVKLQHVPVVNDDDLISLSEEAIGAIKNGFQAVKLEEAGNDDAAVKKWLLLVKELNLQLADESPPFTVPTQMRAFAGQRYTNQMT